MKWTFDAAKSIFELPFLDIIYKAQVVHRENFESSTIQISSLLNIKTGSCPENCSYCPQSAHYKTGLKKEPLMKKEDIITAAKKAKEIGASRFCMGAAWRGPKDSDLDFICEVVKEVKELGLETCVTLGLLKENQALRLKDAGLDYYNHNIDTSKDFYKNIITTRTFEDRLETLKYVEDSGINICCGGIIGLGETNDDRIKMLITLANLNKPPQSVPINKLIKIPGTPLEGSAEVDPFDFVKTIALARILMPKSYVRLSAGRESMSKELQTLCFIAGANSIFYGEVLLTTKNSSPYEDNELFNKLGIKKA